jgi:HNH endonuclease
MSKSKLDKPAERKNLPARRLIDILTESGYRCAVPTCRGILALDMHHIWEVSEGGSDELSNLIALCPTCHALYHRGTIRQESIYCYKAMLVAVRQAFDLDVLDKLLFLAKLPDDYLVVSGDGVLHFARLIAADLAQFQLKANNAWQLVTYTVKLSPKGRMLVSAWKSGDRSALLNALSPPTVTDDDLRATVTLA